MGDVVTGLVVICALLAIVFLAVGLIRLAIKLFVLLVVAAVGLSLLGGSLASLAPWAGAPARFWVVAAPGGGWEVTIPEQAGATSYRVKLDGKQVAKAAQAGTIHVDDLPAKADTYLPGPVRKFQVIAVTGAGNEAQKLDWCAPVVFVAARGTREDSGSIKFGHGMGSRGWRTWMKLAQQLAVSPSRANVLPTVVAGAPVHYPATVVALSAGGYSDSRDQGKADLADRIAKIKSNCPASRIVLFGYSQGADVVASYWQADSTDPEGYLGVVSFADPHFSRQWPTKLAVWPKGGKWPKVGLLGARGKFDDSELAGLQVWCLPGDPVCQSKKTLKNWHGWEYDCYEDWAAYHLAQDVAPHLEQNGWDNVPEPRKPRCIPAVKKSKDKAQSYEPDPWAGVA